MDRSPSSADAAESSTAEDEILAALADYYDGSVAPERRAEIEAKLANDPAWQKLDAELREPKPALASLAKVAAPEQFTAQVTDTIHRRSAGRFFAHKTLGDRVPVGWLVIAAIILLGGLTLVWCRSTTGSLRSPLGAEPPRPAPAEELAPKP